MRIANKTVAFLLMSALIAGTFAAGISAQNMNGGMKAPAGKSAAKLSQDQRILHVLNRSGLGRGRATSSA